MTEATMKTKTLANWFGSNRLLASTVGDQLKGCDWVGVPFCGGCSELPHIKVRGGIANDLHRHIINLALVVRDPAMKADLVKRLDGMLFHPDELEKAQIRCRQREEEWAATSLFNGQKPPFIPASLHWAQDYFVTSWMGRGAQAGTKGEFKGALPLRYNANGGGSSVRFRSAAKSLDAWHEVCKLWEFTCEDAFEMLARVKDSKDAPGLGIYADAPWPDAGDGFAHRFTERQQRQLAEILGAFKLVRVVIRFGDHPLIRELYPESKWAWVLNDSRDQDNKAVREVLIINGPSYAGGAA